jgi:Ca-activated chloride channel family protein
MNGIVFLAPTRLVFLALPLALAIGYLVLQIRRRRYALRFTTLDLLDEVAPDRPGWRRHLPALCLVAGAVAATLAVARPAVAVESTETRRIVVLAIDTSLSMEASDVTPSRVEAAKEAATAFLETVPDDVAVGIVGFDSQARQLIAPTTRLDAVRRTIDRLGLGQGTAIGEAVFLGIETIETAADQFDKQDSTSTDDAAAGVIVLLSDGETTEGRPNDEAAAQARDRGIAVHTIAFGTDAGTVEDPLTGQRVNVPVNRPALAELARSTGGQALRAETADELEAIYERLGRSVESAVERREVTDWFAGMALALMMLAGAGSLVWFGRLP